MAVHLVPVMAGAASGATTLVTTGNITTSSMVAFLAGVTALLAYFMGRRAGRLELEAEQKAARQPRRRKRKASPSEYTGRTAPPYWCARCGSHTREEPADWEGIGLRFCAGCWSDALWMPEKMQELMHIADWRRTQATNVSPHPRSESNASKTPGAST